MLILLDSADLIALRGLFWPSHRRGDKQSDDNQQGVPVKSEIRVTPADPEFNRQLRHAHIK